jgi:hypothetical protein
MGSKGKTSFEFWDSSFVLFLIDQNSRFIPQNMPTTD